MKCEIHNEEDGVIINGSVTNFTNLILITDKMHREEA